MLILNINSLKDILYLIGSVLGIIGFLRTLKKRTKSELNYRTEFGDEVNPFLFCIRGDIYNLEISSKDQSVFALKFPINTNITLFKHKKLDDQFNDKAAFFPVMKEGEIITISNFNLDLPDISLRYEDKYHNKYYQIFKFNKADVGNDMRTKMKSRSCYIISKRYFRFLWIWFPKI